jgi:gamma-glutamyltranspeptidase/glutathione hydrolase
MTVPFTWTLPSAWPRTPVLARNVVCTSQPLAAQAGLAMLAVPDMNGLRAIADHSGQP